MVYLFSDDMCPQQLDSHVDHKQPTEEQDIQDNNGKGADHDTDSGYGSGKMM